MKSKKLLCALATVALSTSFAAYLSACGDHEHTFSEDWTPDGANGHYHAALCDDYDGEKNSFETHKDDNNDGKCDKCDYQMSAPTVAVSGVSISGAETVVAGQTITLTATVAPSNATNKAVTWTSSATAVATVSNGVVTGVAEGTATITVTTADGNKTASKTITVTAPPQADLAEDTWAAAFDFGTKYTFNSRTTMPNANYLTTIQADGAVVRYTTDMGDYKSTDYTQDTGDKKYVYSQSYEYWRKEEVGNFDDYTVSLPSKEQLINIFPFDKFEKGTEDGEYVSKGAYSYQQTTPSGTQTVNISEAKLVFKNNKLVSAEFTRPGNGEGEITVTYGESIVLPEALEGETVTEEEFATALAMADDNYRMGIAMYGQTALEYKQSGAVKYFYTTEVLGEETESYLAKEEGVFNSYYFEFNRWFKRTVPDMTDDGFASSTGFSMLQVDLSAYNYDDFEYDGNTKTYSGSGVIATFKDKKLVSVKANGMIIDLVYGDVNLQLPEIPAGEQITDEEWAAAFEMDYENGEAHIETSFGTFVVKKDGDVMYQDIGYGKVYAAKEGDTYYVYRGKEGVWVKEEVEEDEYLDCLPLSYIAEYSDKSLYTWDENFEAYKTADNSVIIQFVDKKISVISISGEMDIYITYGSTEITLPIVGSEYEDDGSGGYQPGDSHQKMSEEEWDERLTNLFENADNFLLESHDDDQNSYSYAFTIEQGYIVISRNGKTGYSQTVYADEGGKVYKYRRTSEDDTYTKSDESQNYRTLYDVKAELLNFIAYPKYLKEIPLVKCYGLFEGSGNRFSYGSDEDAMIIYFYNSGSIEIEAFEEDIYISQFNDVAVNLPSWHPDFSKVSEEAWYQAFSLDYDNYEINISGGYSIKKADGVIYQNIQGEAYAVKNGEEYYLLQPENGIWTRSELTGEAYHTLYNPSRFISVYSNRNVYEWDAEEEAYVSDSVEGTEGATVKVRFANGKLSCIDVVGIQSMYFNYYISFEVPEEGSPSASGGLDPIVKDLTENQWISAFEYIEDAEAFRITMQDPGERNEILFRMDKGYISMTLFRDGGNEDYVYAVVGDRVRMFTYDESSKAVTVEITENSTLEELKNAILTGMFQYDSSEGGSVDIKNLYEQFLFDGNYYVYEDEGIEFSVRAQFSDGKPFHLSYGYNGPEDVTTDCYFSYDVSYDVVDWFENYKAYLVDGSEWDEAASMNYDSFTIQGSIGDSVYTYQKDGNYYHIVKSVASEDGESNIVDVYLSVDGGTYYRHDLQYGENGTTCEKVVIQKDEFDAYAEMLPLVQMFYGFEDYELVYGDWSYVYVKTDGDERVATVSMYEKKLENALFTYNGEQYDLSFRYDDDIDFPYDRMTEDEWKAAINAVINATNITVGRTSTTQTPDDEGNVNFEHQHVMLQVVLDDNSVYYYENGGNEELYTLEQDGVVWAYTHTEEVVGERNLEHGSLQTVSSALITEFLSPEFLNGESLLDMYDEFEYNYYSYSFSTDEGAYIIISFSKGRIKQIDVGYSETYSEMYEFTDYGTTEKTYLYWYEDYMAEKGEGNN